MASQLKKSGGTRKWRVIREGILKRDNHSCQLCGREGTTVDHIIPRHAFGEGDADRPENLQTLCSKCNFSKGGRIFYEPRIPLTLSLSKSPQNESLSHDED
jgi:5-methylcytosine-specific restriction endonuclease McrA